MDLSKGHATTRSDNERLFMGWSRLFVVECGRRSAFVLEVVITSSLPQAIVGT